MTFESNRKTALHSKTYRILPGLLAGLLIAFSATVDAQPMRPGSRPAGPGGRGGPGGPGGRPPLPPGVQQKLMELQGLQQKLDQIHRQALQDPKIQKKVSAFQSMVEATMRKKDPKVGKSLDRFNKLQAEFEAAKLAKDEKKMRALAPDLQNLARTLTTAQTEAVRSGPLEKKAKKLHETVLAKMKSVDSQTSKYEARVMQLQQELRASMGSKPPGPKPPGR